MTINARRGLVALTASGLLLLATACSDDATTTDTGVTTDASVDLPRGDQGTTPDQTQADGSQADGPQADDATTPEDGASGEGGATIICDPSGVVCDSLPGPCKGGEVRAVVNNCWGKCVPIEQCSDLPAKPDCNISTGITCKMATPTCIKGYVPTRDGTCYGPCVPISTCACTPGGPKEQCPDPNFVCHTGPGRCGPLAP